MKTIDEIRHYFEAELRPSLYILEAERKSVIKKLGMSLSVVWGLGACGYFLLLGFSGMDLSHSRSQFEMIKVFVIISFLLSIGIYAWITRGYKSAFKDQVIGPLVSFIDINLKYFKTSHILRSVYDESRLFPQRLNHFKGDDLVEGRVGETDISFSELYTYYETGSGKNRRRHTVFKGLFFVADFHKHFNGYTLVLPDIAERTFGGVIGGMFQSMNKSRGQVVRLENHEFEKTFAVYSSDQVEARYILSTSLMERIMTFRKKHHRNVHLSFVNSKVFVAISYQKNLFEPKLFTSLYEFHPIAEYCSDLQLALGIVEDLNLNTRIWSKS